MTLLRQLQTPKNIFNNFIHKFTPAFPMQSLTKYLKIVNIILNTNKKVYPNILCFNKDVN